MARSVIDSQNITDTTDAVQLFTADRPRMLAITMKARAGNTGSIFIADDSAAKSSGFEIPAGIREDRTYHPVSVRGTSIWVWGDVANDRLDYDALMED